MTGGWVGTIPPPPHECDLSYAGDESESRVGHVWRCDCGRHFVLRGKDSQFEGYYQFWEPWEGCITQYEETSL